MKRVVMIAVCVGLLAAGLFGASPVPSKIKAGSAKGAVQELTYKNVVSHFKAARLCETQVQPRCTVFYEGEWTSPNVYSYGLFIVEQSDEDVQVTFYLTDAHEMNWITEFLDAPFFTRAETEKLFDLMQSSRDERNKRIGRFRVDFHRWQPKHAEIFVFSFTEAKR
jgi:hypothetical protein